MENIKIKNNIHLLNYTTIKVGGYTEFFAEPKSISELIGFFKWVKLNNLKYRIIGAGSNLLIKNTFHKGLTICTRKLKKIKINKLSGFVEAESGVMLPAMANLLAQNGCEGGEWLIGIPGTIGGAVFMNAGSGNLWISKYLLSVQVLDTKTLSVYTLDKKNLIFNYRFSSFQTNKFVILTANFIFRPNENIKKITYETKENLKNKTNSQPYHLPSFGSVFKNPINNYAGKLIEEVGLKGFSIGGAQVSNIHSNFIVNNENATSEEIYQLITVIQQKVLQKKGIFLHPEVRMIGYWLSLIKQYISQMAGFGLPNFGQITEAFKKAKQIQQDAQKLQEELELMEIAGESEDASIKVWISGNQVPLRVEVNENFLNSDKETVEKNILDAIKKAHESSTTTMKDRMNDLTGGLNFNLPGFDEKDS